MSGETRYRTQLMTNITCLSALAETLFVEFENKIYFRVEIVAREPGQAVESMQFGAEVYRLCWPNDPKSAVGGNGAGSLARQSWLYLDDFPMVCGSTAQSVRKAVLPKLSTYAESHLKTPGPELRRARRAH